MDIQEQNNIFIVDDNKIFSLILKDAIEIFFKTVPLIIHLFETGESCLDKFYLIKLTATPTPLIQ